MGKFKLKKWDLYHRLLAERASWAPLAVSACHISTSLHKVRAYTCRGRAADGPRSRSKLSALRAAPTRDVPRARVCRA